MFFLFFIFLSFLFLFRLEGVNNNNNNKNAAKIKNNTVAASQGPVTFTNVETSSSDISLKLTESKEMVWLCFIFFYGMF